MSLVDDLKTVEGEVADADAARTMVDSLVELGEGALGYLEIAKEQVAEQLPALTEKAEEVMEATKRHIPKVVVAAAALAVAGALVVGAVIWKRQAGSPVAEEDLGYGDDVEADVAEPEISDAEAAVAAAEEVVSQAAEDLSE